MTRVAAAGVAASAVGCGVVDTVRHGGSGHVESTGATAPAALVLEPTLPREAR